MKYDNGVRFYTKGKIAIFFPEEETDCAHCPLCFERKDALKRWECQMTGELIFLPSGGRGGRCPIEFEGEIINGNSSE